MIQTVSNLRRCYPWMCYGPLYDDMLAAAKWHRWLLDRLYRERPTNNTAHLWIKTHWELQRQHDQYKKLLKKLPRPTEQQRKYGDPEPNRRKGLWPEDKMPEIEEAFSQKCECEKYAQTAAACITETEYRHSMLLEKLISESIKEHEESKKKKDKK